LAHLHETGPRARDLGVSEPTRPKQNNSIASPWILPQVNDASRVLFAKERFDLNQGRAGRVAFGRDNFKKIWENLHCSALS
jgi:hypothetical protein